MELSHKLVEGHDQHCSDTYVGETTKVTIEVVPQVGRKTKLVKIADASYRWDN